MLDKAYWKDISKKIIATGKELGFNDVGISDTVINQNQGLYKEWIDAKNHGAMSYLEDHQDIKFDPENILANTKSIISVRLDYLPLNENLIDLINQKDKAYIARYALGRDYHKTLKKKLNHFGSLIESIISESDFDFKYRAITDSAPSPEIEIATQAGLGWRGKNTLLLNKNNGSWFFLGELYTNAPLVFNQTSSTNHCGSCSACIDICPTQAIEKPYYLNASKCISYWTIEHKGTIPISFRKKIGNRIYGCDDCQIICPWNKFAKKSTEIDFFVRHKLNNISLMDCFLMDNHRFNEYFNGSAIRRIGYEKWISNVAIALGNADHDQNILDALIKRSEDPSNLIKEHVLWAISEQEAKK